MAKSKSASRRAAGKKAAKTRKRRVAAKKASTTRKRRAAGKKAAVTRKRRVAGKKAAATRKAKPVVRVPVPPARPSPAMAEIDQRIAIIRNNLRDLTDQAAALSGGSTEELLSDRITEQEAKLALLLKQRDNLAG